MATATPLQPKASPIDLDSHKEVIRKMKAEQDANRDEMLKCCNPSHASACELKKPVYKWRVKATIHEPTQSKPKDRFDCTEDEEQDRFTPRTVEGTVVAQNEGDAWAAFCDRIGMWPSRRYAKPTIKKLSLVDPIAMASKKVATAQGER